MAAVDPMVKRFQQRGRKRKPPRNRGQQYVSQGRAVENVANTKNAAQARADAERTASQNYYRHQLGYDKPGITAKGVKRKAKRVAKRIIPGY